jgi:purine-binding chemotaxis protein CheW
MNDPLPSWGARAADLRREFDRSFAEAPPARAESLADLLAIRVRGEPYALRLAQVSGLFVARRITPLPSPVPELLGIADFSGAIVPVYDLGALLGERVQAGQRWLVVAAEAAIALAFEGFDGHLREPAASIASEPSGRGSRHVQEVLRTAGSVRPIVHLTSILKNVRKRTQLAASKE